MSKTLKVAINEYRTNVIKRSFLLTLLSLPLFLAISIGSGMIMESLNSSTKPIGFVDQAGIIRTLETPWEDGQDTLSVQQFDSVAEARQSLEAGAIQGYFTIPADYLATGDVGLTFLDDSSEDARALFANLLQYNLSLQYAPALAERITAGSDLTVETPGDGRSYPSGGPPFSIVLPVLVSAGFVFLLLMSSGYAMGAVAGERESRTMEVLVTSIPPGALLRGKLLGILGISLTLLVCWGVIGSAAFFIGRSGLDLTWLQQASVDWRALGAVLALALPNYVAALAVMVMVGSTVGEVQEGQALSGMFLLAFFLPIYAIQAIGEQPMGTFPLLLSYMPFASLMAFGLRNLFVVVPASQLIVAVLIQVVVASLLVWLAGRAFRGGMLRAGQRIRLRELLGKGQAAARAGGAG